MQFILILVLIAVASAWFWMCYVFVTQDHSKGWRGMFFWVFISFLLRIPFHLWTKNIDNSLHEWLFDLSGFAVQALFMYIILRLAYFLESSKKKLNIVVIWVVGLFIFGTLLSWVTPKL